MIVIRGLEALTQKYRDVVLTIGNFDGVHRGHQKILKRVTEAARAIHGTAMAMTFDPHPVRVLFPERGMRILTPFEEKARLLELFGMDVLLCIRFTPGFAGTHPDDFIRDVVMKRIGAREVIVGHSYAFGKGKKGTTDILRRRGQTYGFGVHVVRSARILGEVASSSRVRSLISRGRVCEAAWLLGRPYMIEGTVVTGAGRGNRILGIPTANLTTHYEIMPKEGVYAVKVLYEDRVLNGVANIGRNPTFGNAGPSYEVHILDFSEQVLGKVLRLHFIDRIRDERAFRNAGELRDQILKDISRAGDILEHKKYPTIL